ncbi:enoyl-CoA hydratase-related protein [Rhodococcus sp. HM1]|uniref:enoyl-CoA hydratase-related protein n=1 Tax=unclassified Rhodococcus (in: high G+C Gram-positive bacteria) TaxID=192944 RepID=UPI0018CCE795|nr:MULTISPECIES: enoyl-CoA hydratase-related protein [unclassified Rhodococcus (in: high G+C Gram-positive bacteria)]MBH0118304.1 enoyl-CoA hydratase/isomerase family protein [Rhodococcus sp. CX]MCK8669702.1 enoyl-CoA hydratase-related protein [Rhodococcus sp. HM1]
MTVTTTRHDTVTVLNLGDDENRFSPDWLDRVDAALDEIEAGEPTALVTVANGKFYSNGLDLEWLSANGEKAQWYVDRVHGLFARVLTLPVPTIAAINGHAFGAGAMLALAHDFRVMRTDRGFFCLPEVDIRIPFTPGMAALVQAKTTPRTATAAMTTGRRFGGPDALAAGIVDATAEESALVTSAVGTVAPLVGKDPGTLGAIKSTMYASTIAALTTPQS